jgi:rhodanese-related sulfurtransferase
MVWQLLGLLGASVVLGFAFNASSPLGIRFEEPGSDSAAVTATELRTEASLARQSPAPTPPAQNPAARQTPVLPPLPPAPTAEKPVATRQLTPAAPVAPPIATPPVSVPPPPAATPQNQNPSIIHWNEAKPLVASGQAVLVDVRHKSMFDAGHIPGAISLPETSTPDEFTAFLNQYPTNLTLIVYCSSTSCSQSARVATRLVTQYQRPSVKYMTGGYMEYQQAELANQPAQPTQ